MKLIKPGKCHCCGNPIELTSQKFCAGCREEIYVLHLEYVKRARKDAIRDVAKRKGKA